MSLPNVQKYSSAVESQLRDLEAATLSYAQAELADGELTIAMRGIPRNLPVGYEAYVAFERAGVPPPGSLHALDVTLGYDKGKMLDSPTPIQFQHSILAFSDGSTIAISPPEHPGDTDDTEIRHRMGVVIPIDEGTPLAVDVHLVPHYGAVSFVENNGGVALPTDFISESSRQTMASLYFNAARRSTNTQHTRGNGANGPVTARRTVEVTDPTIEQAARNKELQLGLPAMRGIPTMRSSDEEMIRTVNEVSVTMWDYRVWPPVCDQLVLRSDANSVDPMFYGIFHHTPQVNDPFSEVGQVLPPAELEWVPPNEIDLAGMTQMLYRLMD